MSGWLFLFLLLAQDSELVLRAELRPAEVVVGDRFELWVWTPEPIGGGGRLSAPALPVLRGLRWLDSRPETELEPAAPGERPYRRWRWRLRAELPGSWTIPPLLFRLGPYRARTPALQVQVRRPTSAQGQDKGPELWMRTEVSRTLAYPQEPVYVETVLYFRPGLEIRRPQLLRGGRGEGGWWQVIAGRDSLSVSSHSLGGRVYRRVVLERAVWYPFAPGLYRLGGAELECEVLDSQPEEEGLPGGMLGRWMRVPQVRLLRADSVSVRVRPWPPGAPESFGGATGAFSWEVRWPEGPIQIGYPVYVYVRLYGEGNPQAVALLPPALDPKEGGVYLPPDQQISPLGVGRYVLEFRLPLLFQRAGRYRLGDLRWTYFDPIRERYITLQETGPELVVRDDSPEVVPEPPRPAPAGLDWPDWRPHAGRWVSPQRPWWARLEVLGGLALLWMGLLFWTLLLPRWRPSGRGSHPIQVEPLLQALRASKPIEALYAGIRRQIADCFHERPERISSSALRRRLEALPEDRRARWEVWCALLEDLEQRRFRPDPVSEQELSALEALLRKAASRTDAARPGSGALYVAGVAFALLWAQGAGNGGEARPQEAFSAGLRAIQAGRWEEARARYWALHEAGWRSPGLLYNLGLLEARSGRYGLAHYALEEALRLEPRAVDIRRAHELLRERIPIQESTWEDVLCALPVELGGLLCLLGLSVLLWGRRAHGRGFFFSTGLLMGLAGTLYLGLVGELRYGERAFAVAELQVLAPSGWMHIPEGQKLHIAQGEPEGYWVRLSKHRVWVPADAVRLSQWE